MPQLSEHLRGHFACLTGCEPTEDRLFLIVCAHPNPEGGVNVSQSVWACLCSEWLADYRKTLEILSEKAHTASFPSLIIMNMDYSSTVEQNFLDFRHAEMYIISLYGLGTLSHL